MDQNPYDEEDPRYDQWWVDNGLAVPLASVAYENPDEAEAEREYQRVYGGGPEPLDGTEVRVRGSRHEDHRGRSAAYVALDWTM